MPIWSTGQINPDSQQTCFPAPNHVSSIPLDTKQIQILIKYRLSDHGPAIERVWNINSWLQKQDRVCGHCVWGEVETETHHPWECGKFDLDIWNSQIKKKEKQAWID